MGFAEKVEDLQAWHDAGQFYWGRKNAFFENGGVFTANSYPVIVPRHLVQDIDTPEDWARTERMFHTKVSKIVDFQGCSGRSGVSSDIEGLAIAGLRLGAYASESGTPALHSRSPKANGCWYQSMA